MSTRTISLSGARGGHGTTTVAAALALYAAQHGRTELVTDVASTAALVGAALPVTGDSFEISETLVVRSPLADLERPAPQTLVIDTGAPSPLQRAGEHYLVLRGPCYVALASLLARSDARPDGIILVAEPKRSLTARDVTDVLDVPVIAVIDATPDVARTIDAGLLVSRLHRLREFAPLRALATDPYAGRLRPSTAHPRQRLSNPSKIDTELPLSRSDNGAEVLRVAISPSRSYVGDMWSHSGRQSRVEHRAARARRGRLLRGGGRDLGGGLLHGQR